MRKKILLPVFACLLFFSVSIHAHSPDPQQPKEEIRTLVNLLDYISKDYSNAVNNGRVSNRDEYQEMIEFSRQADAVFRQIDSQVSRTSFPDLEPLIKNLQKAIQAKKPVQEISSLADNIRKEILSLNLIDISPSNWPSLRNGADVFATYCQSCHGRNGFGDGPLAAELTPSPSNFRDSTLVSRLSPLQAYNTIRLGIEGTGMRAFRELSDQQAWDVAFYINSLRFQDSVSDSFREEVAQVLKDTASLEALAATPNKDWYSYLKKQGLDVVKAMTVLRSLKKEGQGNGEKLLRHAVDLLQNAYEAYKKGDSDRANVLALNAYLDSVEPVESQIKARDPSLVSHIETQMIDIRSAIKSNASVEVLQEKINAAVFSIREARNIVGTEDYSFWFTFIVSGSILLRESLEAFLIILVILSVLKSVNAERVIKYVHGGWMTALLLGISSWFFTESLIHMGSFEREMMEGIGSLIAVALLLHVGFWLHNKTHASQWTKFIEDKIYRLADNNNRWGLAFLSFIVVFREAFESVIFLSSISIKSTSTGNSGILFGTISALAAVIILGVILLKFTRHIPIRALFRYSSIIMALLAIILVGKGIHEFQEAGYLGINMLPFYFDLPTIGLYATLQTIIAQLIIACTVIGLWYFSNRWATMQEAR